MSGVRCRNEELLAMGLTLPGFVERSKVIASLPSLGLLTLAGMTPEEVEVSYVDVPEPGSLKELPGDFDVVAISSFTAQIKEAYKLADRYREAGVTVLMGGLHVTARPEEALQHADSVLLGEGESLWPRMIADLQANRHAVGEVSDFTIERCVFWPTVANIFRAGWVNQSQSLTTRRVTVRDCDVIHISPHEWMGAADALFTTVSPDGKGACLHSDYLFENIRCESPAALLSVNWPEATLRNFRFKDIRLDAGANKSLLRANAEGVHIENIRVAG
ncbi:MAG: hypothetical protein QOE70_5749 [Chthoniobacter sp.]|nr:hypothetical protein [Chthoniobacter sp.]